MALLKSGERHISISQRFGANLPIIYQQRGCVCGRTITHFSKPTSAKTDKRINLGAYIQFRELPCVCYQRGHVATESRDTSDDNFALCLRYVPTRNQVHRWCSMRNHGEHRRLCILLAHRSRVAPKYSSGPNPSAA